MEIRVIREIRVLLNIEILVFSIEYLWGSLYEFNYSSNKELSIFTGQQYKQKRRIMTIGFIVTMRLLNKKSFQGVILQ